MRAYLVMKHKETPEVTKRIMNTKMTEKSLSGNNCPYCTHKHDINVIIIVLHCIQYTIYSMAKFSFQICGIILLYFLKWFKNETKPQIPFDFYD